MRITRSLHYHDWFMIIFSLQKHQKNLSVIISSRIVFFLQEIKNIFYLNDCNFKLKSETIFKKGNYTHVYTKIYQSQHYFQQQKTTNLERYLQLIDC